MDILKGFWVSFIVFSLSYCAHSDPADDWMLQEYERFVSTGSAYRITNSLCGRFLLTKPPNRTDDQIFPDWREYGSRNPTLCECASYAPQGFKYAFFMYLRAHVIGHNTYADGPMNVDALMAANKTLHILANYDELPTYYEFEENGTLAYDFALDLSMTLAEKNRTAVYQEHYFSYVLRRMVAEKISFSFLKPRRSLWEKFASEDGVRAFVTDFDSIPEKQGNRTYSDAWSHYAYFKHF